MSKRTWIAVIALVASLLIAATGTLAYLTDTDSDVNVMTLGNVDIEQHEMKRKDGIAYNATLQEGDLEPFVDGIKLYPAYPVNGEATDYTAAPVGDMLMWGPYVHTGTAGNGLWNESKLVGAVDKFVFVENTGDSPAFFRTLIAFECPDGVDIGEPSQGAQIMINVNGSKTVYNAMEDRMVGTIVVDGIQYAVFEYIYQDALLPGEWSHPSLLQVVMTHNATNETVELLGETYEILALSQAVQVENLEQLGAEKALDAAFGDVDVTNATKWFSEMEGMPVQTASTAEELTAALAEGGTILVNNDIELIDEPIVLAQGTDATIVVPEGVTISGTATEAKAACQIEVKNGASLTLSGGGTIEFISEQPDPAYGYGTNTINNSGDLVIDGITLINKTNGGSSNAIDNAPGSTLVVNSGTIQAEKIAIRLRDNAKVTINDGDISGSRAVQVHLFQNVKKPTELTINGGTMTGNPAVYSIANGSVTHEFNSITITGGTFNGDVLFGGGNKVATEKVTITGGTFNGELGRYLANDGWEDIPKP